jgi:hypothetical protein
MFPRQLPECIKKLQVPDRAPHTSELIATFRCRSKTPMHRCKSAGRGQIHLDNSSRNWAATLGKDGSGSRSLGKRLPKPNRGSLNSQIAGERSTGS